MSKDTSEILNLKSEEDGLKMFDMLSRISSSRQLKPLDQDDYIIYDHRSYYDEYNLRIGDVYIMVPPEFIYVSSESFSQQIQTLRQENSQKQKTGYHKRTLQIDLVFNGMDEINGYKVPSPAHKDDGRTTTHYYVDGLRTLLAQFKCTPFLPIVNELINDSYKIYVVALQSIVISTIDGFQNALTAHITLQEVDMMPYIEMPNIMFRHVIDWDLFRYYTQSLLTQRHEYKKLQALPVNKDHTAFKLSVLNEDVLQTVEQEKTSESSREETLLKKVTQDENYTCLIDSEEYDVHISSFQCSYANMLTSIQMSDSSSPTLQYIGGLDTQFGITFETTDTEVVGAIEQCQIVNDLMVRNNPKVRGAIGFVKIEADFVTFCGSLFCTIESVETHTVQGIPGLYEVRLLCVSYDIAQSRRESLNGFLPFDGKESSINDLEKTGKDLEKAIDINKTQSIEQSYNGLVKKIYQDNYAEWKLRTSMEVYPDLRLPTYDEVNTAIANINDFRRENGLKELPYSIYPTQPSYINFGKNKTYTENYDGWLDNGGDNYYQNGNLPQCDIYEGFVDPDFYVFYPNSYLSLYKQEQEDSNNEEQSNGSSNNSSYSESIKNKKIKYTVQETQRQAYGYGEITDTTINGFINSLKKLRGCRYCANAEGEVNDYIGPMFDDLGLITHVLKGMGILPDNFNRLKAKSLKTLDIFEKVSSKKMKRGDILTDSANTIFSVCTGLDEFGNVSIIGVNEKYGVTEEQLFYAVKNVYRIIPLQLNASISGTSQTDPYVSDGNQYPDENGKIKKKKKTALETTDKYSSSNPYSDENSHALVYSNDNSSDESTAVTNNTSGKNGTSKQLVDQDLGKWSPLSEKEMNDWINSVAPKDSPFRNQGKVFLEAAKQSGLDPRYILSHAALESSWGRDHKAVKSHNYFGYGAFDSNVTNMYKYSYPTLEAGIIGIANRIAKYYYNSQYKQKSLSQMRWNNNVHQYATAKDWDSAIAKIMATAPENTSKKYLSKNTKNNDNSTVGTSDAPSSHSSSSHNGSVTNAEQIKLNEYDRRNRDSMADELYEDTKDVELNQADISDLDIPDIEYDGSDWTDGKVKIKRYIDLTTDEFNALALTIATECEGETIACKMAMAQFIYDMSQEYYSGQGLTLILKNGYFKEDKTTSEVKDVNEAKNCVRNVFIKGLRWRTNYKILGFTSFSNSNYASQYRRDKYEEIGNVNQHTFFGFKGQSEAVGYNLKGYGVGQASNNNVTKEETFKVDAKYANVNAFGKPIYIKSKHFDSHDSSVGEEWQKLNSDENRIMSSFVDDCQYSAKGRMVKAFPTFLFCILDDSAQWYDARKLWTNYYVYKPVVDIQYHAANDMPTETAQITVTNTYHNLDRSSAALINYSLASDEEYDDNILDNAITSGIQAGATIAAGVIGYNLTKKYHTSINRWLYKNTGMMVGGIKITNRLIQMHSILFNHTKVREGARVHLRMGYGSDPLSLAPIINGTISGLSLGDQISIIITSDGHELIQNVTSDKSKDINNGALGLFGLGATQEAANIISQIIVKRESWINHLWIGRKWFEGSKYNIEHFGLYINKGNQYALQGGIDTGIYEQYDLLMNIYNAAVDDATLKHFRHWSYMYNSIIPWRDGEENFVFNKYNMTPWDTFQLCAQTMPEYLIKAERYQFDSRVYYGLPFDLTKYRYDVIDGTIYQECKANTQMHYVDSLNTIIENQVSVTSRNSFTNAKVIYTRGNTPKSTAVIHSDDTIDNSKQSTHIIDSPIVQDYIGFDAVNEFFGCKQGRNAAENIGVSNLLYGWQQQYQGQLLCLGVPHIRPDDYLMVNDFYTALNGICVVREVIHSFSTSTGFTSSIIPGVIGFSPKKDTGNIVVIANYLKLYGQFTQYAQSRKTLKENCERYADYISVIDRNDRLQSQLKFYGLLDNFEAGVGIAKKILVGEQIFHTIRAAKNAGGIIKGIKAVKGTYDTIKTVGKIKSIHTLKQIMDSIVMVSRGVESAEEAGLAIAGGSAVFTGGLSLAAFVIISIAIDTLLGGIVHWLENRNTIVLLPLWWEGSPFISGIKDGEKILLIKNENNGSEENTEADGFETDEDEITVEDN